MENGTEHGYQIRRVTESELDGAFRLIWRVFEQFVAPDYSAEGAAWFYDTFISGQAFRQEFRDGRQTMYGAFAGDTLAGVLAVSRQGHVSCVFVDAAHHRRGAATGLFEAVLPVLREQGVAAVRLNASPYGLPFYHALGFADTGPETTQHGIRYTPMELRL